MVDGVIAPPPEIYDGTDEAMKRWYIKEMGMTAEDAQVYVDVVRGRIDIGESD